MWAGVQEKCRVRTRAWLLQWSFSACSGSPVSLAVGEQVRACNAISTLTHNKGCSSNLDLTAESLFAARFGCPFGFVRSTHPPPSAFSLSLSISLSRARVPFALQGLWGHEIAPELKGILSRGLLRLGSLFLSFSFFSSSSGAPAFPVSTVNLPFFFSFFFFAISWHSDLS